MAGRFRYRMRRRQPWRRSYRRRWNKRVRRIAFSIAEKKYLDICFNPNEGVVHSTFALCGTGQLGIQWADNQVSLLGTMGQGAAEGERIGNRIFVKYVQLQLFFEMLPDKDGNGIDADTAGLGLYCRYMLLHDKQPGGTAIPRATMSTTFGQGGTNIPNATVSAFKAFNTLRRYKTLLDKQHQRAITSMAYDTATPFKLNAASTTGAIVIQHYIPVNKQYTFTQIGSATDMKAAAAVMQDGDLLFQVCPSDDACCKCFVGLRICYRDA